MDTQLALPLAGADHQAPGATATRPMLVAFRSRSALWEQTPTATRRFSTVRDVLDRVRLLGLLTANANLLRDDGAALWASASELATRSPWAVRLARDLASLHTSWTHAGVDVDRVHGSLEDRGGRQDELADLLASLIRVRGRLAAAGAVDAATALALGLDAAREGRIPPSLARFSLIELRHWVDPTELELDVMLALARAGLPLRFVLPLDTGGRGLTAAIEWIHEAIFACADAPSLELVHEQLSEGAASQAFTQSWYSAEVQSPALVADLPVRIEVARDHATEADRIAGIVAHWASTTVPMPRIAVATRTLDDQAARIEDALRGYGLPVLRREGPSLVDTAPGQVIAELLRLRRDGVPRERLLTLLAQPAFRFSRSIEEVGSFSGVLRRAAARTDVEDSRRPSGGYRHRLERYADSQREHRPEEADLAERALEAIEAVLELTTALPQRATLPAFLRATRELVDAAVQPAEDEMAFRVLRELIGDALRSHHRVAADLFDEGSDDESAAPIVDLAAYRTLLLRLLGAARLPPDAGAPAGESRAHHAVEIASLPQLLGRRFDYVVIADCVHGKLPAVERTDPLLTETDRILINASVGERVLKWAEVDPLTPSPLSPRQALEPLWFLGAASAAQRGLFISAAGRDMRGRELAPSEFLQEALLAMGVSPGAALAGSEWPGQPHPRRVQLAAAQAALDGDDVGTLDAQEVDWLERCDRMAAQRRAYFARDKQTPAEAAVSPFAYAVAPERMREHFGYLLGLTEERPLTPTRLESLATCRFRGFVESMLRVETGGEAGQDADARALGRLAHKVLERFYAERAEAGVHPARINDEDRARLKAIVVEEAAPMRAGRETGHLAALDANVAWLETSLTRTVTLLAQQPPVPGARPHRFELNIGVGKEGKPPVAPPVAIELDGEVVYLGGEIDRVDKGDNVWVVVDYKNSTGARVTAKVAERELLVKHFQLPLYLRLITDRMKLHPRVELAAYLISLRDGVPSPVLGENVGMRRRVLDDEAEDGLAAGLGRVVLPLLDGQICADEGTWCRGCRVARACRRPQAGAGLVSTTRGAG